MKTTDLWLAAYLIYEKKLNFSMTQDERKTYFDFEVSNEDWNNLKMEFSKSHYSNVKWNIEKVKDLAF